MGDGRRSASEFREEPSSLSWRNEVGFAAAGMTAPTQKGHSSCTYRRPSLQNNGMSPLSLESLQQETTRLMRNGWTTGLLVALTLIRSLVSAQQACPNGTRVEGAVTDPTGAVIPGASVQGAGTVARADATGHYVLACVSANAIITAQADGFANRAVRVPSRSSGAIHLNIQLTIASVQTDVQVSGDGGSTGLNRASGAVVLNTDQVQQLADDPDDFVRQLQMLASTAGGGNGSATIMVDGFRNPSAMPPKGSISSITVNADLFDPEFQTPAWFGGLIQIFTKPGADRFHGAVFFTDSDGSFNATDPFSLTATPAGKRRYGFELSGPAISKKTDFSLAHLVPGSSNSKIRCSLANFTLDAERWLTALYQCVRTGYGDDAAQAAADCWLRVFEERLEGSATFQT